MRKPNPTVTTTATSSSASVVNVAAAAEPQPSQLIDGLPVQHIAPAPPHDIILPASDPDDHPTSSAPLPPLPALQSSAQEPAHGGYSLGHDMMAATEAGMGAHKPEEGVVGDHEHHGSSDEVDMDMEDDTVGPLTNVTLALEFGAVPGQPQGPFPGPLYPYHENWVPVHQSFGWAYDEQPHLQQAGSIMAPSFAIMASIVSSVPPGGFDEILPYPPPHDVSAQPTSNTHENTTTNPPLHVAGNPNPAPQQPVTLPPLNPAANPHHTMPPPPPPPPPPLPQGLPSTPNFIPGGLTPANAGLVDFLRIWVLSTRNFPQRAMPVHSQIETLASSRVRSVRFGELMGDQCDLQGINWDSLGVTRETARRRRLETYSNYTNNKPTDSCDQGELDLPNLDGYYRFQRTLMRRNVVLAHFQLRSVLACPSRNHAFYAGSQGVHRINMAAAHGVGDIAIDFSDMPSMQVTTLDANHGVLVAGTFNGEYFLKRLDSENDRYANGQITNVGSPITNHLQLVLPRASGPAAAFSSNDNVFRSMDVATEEFLLSMPHKVPMNCSAISPDRRLRVMVGDQTDVLIADAETGQILQSLSGHRDFGFACDWSQDGWTVATGFQDKTVKIWDARRWCDSSGRSLPLTSIRSEMAGVRGLRFSPVGGGPRVLVAAEEADYVNIIEARNFETKQTFDLFGEIGGVAFANEGNDLNVLVADKTRGGIVKFEQCGIGYDFDADSIHQTWVPRGDSGPVIDHSWSRFPRWGDGLKASKRQRAAVRERMEPF